MTTIDYKEKYEQALERARQFSENPYLEDSAGIVEYIFPELKESEDEMIRKQLLKHLREVASGKSLELSTTDYERWATWVEKQGEITKEWSEMKINNIQTELQDMVDLKQKTEQGEQKPADKVETKFKVGDKIKLAEEPKYPAREIIAIKNDAYYFDELVHLPFSNQDKWELVEQKPAWSENDEQMLNHIICYIESLKEQIHYKTLCDEEINWLKSLKERILTQNTWKPSESDILLLERIANGQSNPQDFQASLGGLIGQLKKLKG